MTEQLKPGTKARKIYDTLEQLVHKFYCDNNVPPTSILLSKQDYDELGMPYISWVTRMNGSPNGKISEDVIALETASIFKPGNALLHYSKVISNRIKLYEED